MTTLFDCALDGVSLSSLDERICVLDIREDAPKMHISTMTLHSGAQELLSRSRESLSVHICFAIHEEDPVRRRTLLRSINRWAEQGGTLTTTERPGLQLHVMCSALPAMSGKDWTEELTLTFTSSHMPYWEDAMQTSVSGAGTLTLTTPGTLDAVPIDLVAINTSAATVTSLTITCGETKMTFSGISLSSGGQFALTQSGGRLTACVGDVSVLNCRTQTSDDALLAPCGQGCTITVSASTTLQIRVNVRGRYA